ncbi:MAG: hypothetical protein M3313_13680 [Actinomycetota bacterium]|nr:hypothetical protein [Actinomycetota bacterium]
MTTSPHPPGGPNLDVLADLSANLLPAAQDRSVRAHAEGCADCTQVLRALDQTGHDLRWLPPISMPADVIARVDAALDLEASAVSIGQLRDRRKRRQQLTGIAAAGVIVLGGGGVALSQVLGDSPGGDVTAGGQESAAPVAADLPDLDATSLPDAVGALVTGGEGDEPLRLDGTPAPQDCVPSVQVAGVDELIGVIEIRYRGRDRDAVFFTTSDPAIARVIVVDDCSLESPEIEAIDEGRI